MYSLFKKWKQVTENRFVVSRNLTNFPGHAAVRYPGILKIDLPISDHGCRVTSLKNLPFSINLSYICMRTQHSHGSSVSVSHDHSPATNPYSVSVRMSVSRNLIVGPLLMLHMLRNLLTGYLKVFRINDPHP